MPYLVAAVVLLGAAVAVNLLLTVGLVRRLREHAEKLRTMASRTATPPPGYTAAGALRLPTVGATIDEFAATTLDGEPVSRELLAGHTLVAFVAPNCTSCVERLPELVAYAAARPGGRAHVLAVVAGEDHRTTAIVERLKDVARIIVEEPEGELQRAFSVGVFPALCVVDQNGVVVASGVSVDTLPSLVT
jgi:hypothetical protein